MLRPALIAAALLGLAAPALAQPSFMPPVQVTDPAPDGRRVEADGLLGNYYPAKAKGPAILLLGGSEGGLGIGAARQAQALQAAGFSVLHLSYYRAPGQPEVLALVPLELFDRALGWLGKQPEVDPKRLGVIGGSKGAEAALLVAARRPDLRAIVAGMPSSVVWPGISWTGAETRSTWSAGGKPLPALAYGGFTPGGTIEAIYTAGLASLPQRPETRIPVERIKAAILLVCGEADTLWPSCPMARHITAKVPSAQLLAYKDAGHAVFGPPLAPDNPGLRSLAQLGGTVDGNNNARADGWPKVVAFLRSALGL